MRTATFDRIHFVLSWSALLAVPILFCTPVGDRLEHKFQAWRSGTNTSLKPVAQRAAQVKTEGRDNEMAGNAASRGVNVLKSPLAFFSSTPQTGFTRSGYCEVPPSDMGNHSVAAELNDSFLDFTAARGNNLRAAGLTAGCKWCVCAARWREALDASRNSGVGDGVVPKVHLDATHQKALDAVNLDDLKRFAVKKD